MRRLTLNLFANPDERFIPSSPASLIGTTTRVQNRPAIIVAAKLVDEHTITVTIELDDEWPGEIAQSDSAGRNPRPG